MMRACQNEVKTYDLSAFPRKQAPAAGYAYRDVLRRLVEASAPEAGSGVTAVSTTPDDISVDLLAHVAAAALAGRGGLCRAGRGRCFHFVPGAAARTEQSGRHALDVVRRLAAGLHPAYVGLGSGSSTSSLKPFIPGPAPRQRKFRTGCAAAPIRTRGIPKRPGAQGF